MTDTQQSRLSLAFSHLGIFVHDLSKMAKFYTEVLGFTKTDEGNLGETKLVFLSRDPSEHHQIALVSGRPQNATFSMINQISFRVPNLDTLRAFKDCVQSRDDASELCSISHGNAVSIYFRDPEKNRIEIFMDTPWYCEQPLREEIDLNQTNEAILASVELSARSRPGFSSRENWMSKMAILMGQSN